MGQRNLSASSPSPQVSGNPAWWSGRETLILLASLAALLGLGLLLGHAYDIKIFMATGYLVATRQNPYLPQDLTAVFRNSAFQGLTSIGYPPPWPLILGLIYRMSYAITPNLLVYNLAIKLPTLAALVALAFLVARMLQDLGAAPGTIRKAWGFMLLSPFLIYFGAAWGQFDPIVALLSLLSLYLLGKGRTISPAVWLALAIAFKPTAIPLLPVAFVYLWGASRRRAVIFSLVVLFSLVLFCAAPFILFGWDPAPILHGWNAHFTVAGGMSWLTFFELLKDSYHLPGLSWLLGLVWIPAMLICLLALRHGVHDFKELLMKSTGFMLVFFLTRTWVSEPNISLLLPFVLILTCTGDLDRLALAAVWILPLVFTVFNNSPPQLLFPAFPEAMGRLLSLDETIRTPRLILRVGIVILWQIAGWWIVFQCFTKRPLNSWRRATHGFESST